MSADEVTYSFPEVTLSRGQLDMETGRELAFIALAVAELSGWDEDRRGRVIRYLNDRFGS